MRASLPSLLAAMTLAAMTLVVTGFEAQSQPVPPAMRAPAQAVMNACRSDYERLCATVSPGGGRILACLQRNAAALSTGCRASMPAAEALRDQAKASGAMPR